MLDITALIEDTSDMTLEGLITGIYYTIQKSIVKEKLKMKEVDEIGAMRDLYLELKEIFESDDI